MVCCIAFTDTYSSFFVPSRSLDLTIRNTGDEAPVRIVAVSYYPVGLLNPEYRVAELSVWPEGGVRFLQAGQSADVELHYSTRYTYGQSNIYPSKIEIFAVVGPFLQEGPIVETFYPVPTVIPPLQGSVELAEIASSARSNKKHNALPCSTSEGPQRLDQLTSVTPSLILNEELALTSSSLEYTRNITVSPSAHRLRLELYPVPGSDMDLHLYENGLPVGFVPKEGQAEVEFPCIMKVVSNGLKP